MDRPIRNHAILAKQLFEYNELFFGNAYIMCKNRNRWIKDIDLFEKEIGYKFYLMKEKTFHSTILCGKEEKDKINYE